MDHTFTRAIGGSLLTMLCLVLASSLILATILRLSSLSEHSIGGVTMAITLIITFIGGMVAAMKAGAKGWLFGLLAGVMFVIFAITIQYLGYGNAIMLSQLLLFSLCLVTAMVGGMIGVGIRSSIR
ncbi:hypothetical protein DH09_08685 [Bacillaceae bacterium JMAK1]|nr:hypothetical protein DH09_08685 [Bacillaceae bacterium JMAK1]